MTEAAGLHVRWHGAPEGLPRRGRAGALTLDVPEGEHHDLVLEISDVPLPRAPVDAEQAWAATEEAWSRAAPPLSDSLAPGDVAHSWAVLRGLTSRADGMVAAATMALPEQAERGATTTTATRGSGTSATPARRPRWPALTSCSTAFRFVSSRLLADGPHLKPAYTVQGGGCRTRRLDLPGYPGGTVRWQPGQRAVPARLARRGAAPARHRGPARPHRRRAQRRAARRTSRHRALAGADAGIWELGTAVDALAAHVRAGLRATPRRGPGTRRRTGPTSRTDPRDQRELPAPVGPLAAAADDERVDASLLVPAVRGAVARPTTRAPRTVRRRARRARRDGYVYRFRHGPAP